MDHKHKTKKEKVGENGAGLIRGILLRSANAWEGKVSNNFKRMGLHKMIDLPSALRNLANYLENPNIEQIYIHPSEIEEPKKLQKNCFKKLSKMYSVKYPERKQLKYPERKQLKHPKRKQLKYSKTKRISKNLKKLFKEFKIEIKYLK